MSEKVVLRMSDRDFASFLKLSLKTFSLVFSESLFISLCVQLCFIDCFLDLKGNVFGHFEVARQLFSLRAFRSLLEVLCFRTGMSPSGVCQNGYAAVFQLEIALSLKV